MNKKLKYYEFSYKRHSNDYSKPKPNYGNMKRARSSWSTTGKLDCLRARNGYGNSKSKKTTK